MPPLNRLAWTALVLVFASANASSVTFDWVTVGDPRNPPDTAVLIDPKTGDDTRARHNRSSCRRRRVPIPSKPHAVPVAVLRGARH